MMWMLPSRVFKGGNRAGDLGSFLRSSPFPSHAPPSLPKHLLRRLAHTLTAVPVVEDDLYRACEPSMCNFRSALTA